MDNSSRRSGPDEPVQSSPEQGALGRPAHLQAREVYHKWSCGPGNVFNQQNLISCPSRYRACPKRLFSITVIQDDWLQPFSYGKRKCIGESVAKNTVFLMFANVIKKFNVTTSRSYPLPDENPVGGLTIGPQKFYAEVSLR